MYLRIYITHIHTQRVIDRGFCQHWANILYLPRLLFIHSLLFLLNIKKKKRSEVGSCKNRKGKGRRHLHFHH